MKKRHKIFIICYTHISKNICGEREKDMKRKRMLILAVTAAVFVLAVLIAVFCVGKKEPVLTQGETALTEETVVKAAKNEFMMRITEGKDVEFSDFEEAEAAEEIENCVSSVKNGFCKSVIVKAKAFSKIYDAVKDGEKPDEKKNAAFFSFIKKLSENNIRVYAELDFSFPVSYSKALLLNENLDGILINSLRTTESDEVNQKLSFLHKASEAAGKKLILYLSDSYPYTSSLKLDETRADLVMLPVTVDSDKTDIKAAVKKTAELSRSFGVKASALIGLSPFSEKKLSPGKLLELFLEIEKAESFGAVAFNSLEDALDNTENCFSAVEKYVNDGLVLSTALRPLSIDGYDGGVLETDNYHLTLKINGSALYPAYLDKERFMFDSDGETTVELSLKTGLNEFVISQNGKTVIYKMKARFSGELIKSVEPAQNITAYMNKTSTLTVYAASGSDVTVKVGAKKVQAKAQAYESGGYRQYIADIKMPGSRMEIESIGRLYVTAVLGSQTLTVEGPNVVFSVPETTTAPSVTLPAVNSDKQPPSGFTVSESRVSGLPQASSGQNAYVTASSSLMPYTGNQMCVVTANYADTWPSGTNSDTFVPFYTTLAAGTMDYIVGQSEAYDSEEEKTRYFYELSCGRRVQRDDVMLLEKYDMGLNSLSVSSCKGNGGELEIVLSTKWKVPYSFSFAPQTYRAGYNKLYHVDSFTAETIQFTFYHTASASGKIDASISNVISSAYWGTDSSSGAVTLTMPLRNPGRYYGYSLSYDSNDNLILRIQNKPQTLQGAVIVLDPGHGGNDSGAVGFAGAVREADLNFNTAVAVMNELQKKGATVYLTRYEDKTLSLEERKYIARSLKPDVFVSIHANGSVNASNYGTSTYYFRPMSKPLAKSIYDELVTAWQGLYASSPEKLGKISRGCDFHPFSVTRLEECPSVLIEVGYVTNNDDCAMMAEQTGREKLAVAIANGIERFINS